MLIAEEFLLLVLDDGSGKRTIERDPDRADHGTDRTDERDELGVRGRPRRQEGAGRPAAITVTTAATAVATT
jgi:hypothetical protein